MKNDDKGIYAFYSLSEKSIKAMGEWIESVGIVEPLGNDKLHVTTVYSKKTFDIIPSNIKIMIDKSSYKIAIYEEALVLEVKSEELQKLNKQRMDAGAVSDYPIYKPHLTLSYAASKNNKFINDARIPKFDILLTHETVEPINKNKMKEETNSGSVDIYSNPASVRKVSSKIFKRIKEERNIKNWKEIVKEYNFECFGNESIKIENDSSNEWFFIKYGTLNI